jgi:hypothetical protein
VTFARFALIAGLVSAVAVLQPSLVFAQHDAHAGMDAPQAASIATTMAAELALPMGIPDFCANSSAGVPAGQTQTWSGSQALDCVGVHGTLVLQGSLTVDTLIVYAGGFLDVQSGATITFRNTPINLATDPRQWGRGLIVLGRVRMIGEDKTPFVRTSSEPVAGETTLTLTTIPAGWQVGDELFVPDTRQVPSSDWFNPNFALQHETRSIAAISGATITLTTPLTYDHRGARDANGSPTVLRDGTRLFPHVANLTRSITIRSASPTGTRGHTVYTDRADVEIRNVAFRDLGRTTTEATFDQDNSPNQIGRYPLHIHMLQGPVNPANTGYQFTVTGNVIRDTRKWPLAIHASSYGLIEGNVIVGGAQRSGAGIALENGQEVENLIRGNFVADIRGHENARNTGSAVGAGAGNTEAPPSDGRHAGTGGECYWAVGFYNRFVNNVATGCRNSAQQIVAGVGWKFFLPPAPSATRVMQPTTRGADPSQYVERVAQNLPLLEFDGNEVYGLAADGITIWQLGTDGYGWNASQAESVIRNLKIWHTYESGVWLYPVNRVTVEGLVFRHDAAVGRPSAIMSGDYRNVDLTVRGGDIHAGTVFGETIDLVGTTRLENIRATTYNHALTFQTPATPGTQAGRPASGTTAVVTNSQITPWPGRPLGTIRMLHRTDKPNSHTSQPYVVTVTEGASTFRVCFPEQATQSLYGGTCQSGTTQRADIAGLVSGSAPATPPVPEPSPPPLPSPTPGTQPIPPSSPGGDPPYCYGLNCLPIEGPLIRNLAAVTSASPASTAGDYDGDGKADPTLFHPATGLWHTLTSRSGNTLAMARSFGAAGDVPVPGDYDGDGRADAALFRPATGKWLITESRQVFSSVRSYSFEAASDDVPVPADYDGDHRTDLAVFRPSTGIWSIRSSRVGLMHLTEYRWGVEGDLPATADFDGDGRADPTVYRPATGTWHVLTSTTGFVLGLEYRFGEDGDLPVPGDFDGDGRADLSTYHAASGVWRVLTSTSGFVEMISRLVGNGDVAVIADDDGDGRADFRIYRRATGEWLLWSSSSAFSVGHAGHAVRHTTLPGALAIGAAPAPLRR